MNYDEVSGVYANRLPPGMVVEDGTKPPFAPPAEALVSFLEIYNRAAIIQPWDGDTTPDAYVILRLTDGRMVWMNSSPGYPENSGKLTIVPASGDFSDLKDIRFRSVGLREAARDLIRAYGGG
ncbi:MAG: hypothetical protein ACYCX3_02650 [Thermoleophilia bacterium]